MYSCGTRIYLEGEEDVVVGAGVGGVL